MWLLLLGLGGEANLHDRLKYDLTRSFAASNTASQNFGLEVHLTESLMNRLGGALLGEFETGFQEEPLEQVAPAGDPYVWNIKEAKRRVAMALVRLSNLAGLFGVGDDPAPSGEQRYGETSLRSKDELDRWAIAFRDLAIEYPGDPAVLAFGYVGLYRIITANVEFSNGEFYMEGFSTLKEVTWLMRQVNARVRRVCQVGFNAGHSAIAFLLARPNVELVSFDLLEHPYGRPAEAFVATAFPGRHRVFAGPSNRTLLEFAMAHPEERCDLAFVDGAHTEEAAFEDLMLMSLLAPTVVMDDVGCQSNFCDGPAKAWQRMQDAGRIREHLCEDDIGGARWCFGCYQTA
jgi:hypothetical protein